MAELGYEPDRTGLAAFLERNGPMAFGTGLSFVLGFIKGFEQC